MSTCANCGKEILEPGISYGINPEAVCHCCIHDRRVAQESGTAMPAPFFGIKPVITDEAIHKMCEYLEHDKEGSPCMKCPEWEEIEHHGRCQRACYGLAREGIEKALKAVGII